MYHGGLVGAVEAVVSALEGMVHPLEDVVDAIKDVVALAPVLVTVGWASSAWAAPWPVHLSLIIEEDCMRANAAGRGRTVVRSAARPERGRFNPTYVLLRREVNKAICIVLPSRGATPEEADGERPGRRGHRCRRLEHRRKQSCPF